MTQQKRASLFLVSPYSDITAHGVRVLSATLRRAGHRVRTLFLLDKSPIPGHIFRSDFVWKYSPEILKQTAELAAGFDLVGISLITNYFGHAVQLTDFLHKHIDVPIIWGGVHPTVSPEDCLEHADMVCISEAEDTMLEAMNCLNDGKSLSGIQNLWLRGEPRPEIRKLTLDLESLPFIDLDFDDQFVLHPDQEKIVPLTDDLFVHYSSNKAFWDTENMFYQILTSRGCPYGCSFCINNYVKKLHRSQKTYRRRSFDNVFRELEQAANRFPIELVMISDDSFFACSEDELEAFAEEYKRRINIPFRCLATPKNVTERKLKTLMNAGMIWLEVGIQSCATETLKMYRRQWGGVEEIRRASKILAPFQEQVEVFYDIIIDNPWEPVKDTVQTLREVVELSRPYRMQLFSLTLFPGTELYQRGVQEGLVKDIHKEIYQKQFFVREFTYLSFVLSLIYRNLPRWILRIMLSGPAVTVFHRAYMKPVFKAAYGSVRFLRMLKHLLLPLRRIVVEKSDGNTA